MFNGERLEEIRRIWEGIYFLKRVGAIHLFFCHPLFLVSHRQILGRWAITWPVTLTRPRTSVGHILAFNLSFCPPQLSGVTLQAVALITHAMTGNRANEEAGIGGPQPRRQPHGFPTTGIHVLCHLLQHWVRAWSMWPINMAEGMVRKDYITLGPASCHVTRFSSNPMERCSSRGTGPYPRGMWVSHLGSGSSSPSQGPASHANCSFMREYAWACTTQLSHSHISGPQKMCETRNVNTVALRHYVLGELIVSEPHKGKQVSSGLVRSFLLQEHMPLALSLPRGSHHCTET